MVMLYTFKRRCSSSVTVSFVEGAALFEVNYCSVVMRAYMPYIFFYQSEFVPKTEEPLLMLTSKCKCHIRVLDTEHKQNENCVIWIIRIHYS